MENNLKKYRGASLWENNKNIIADVYIATDVNLMAYDYEERIRLLQEQNKELEKEIDYARLQSGYVAFMESQARIKELERKCDKLENKITELEDELDEKG